MGGGGGMQRGERGLQRKVSLLVYLFLYLITES